MRRALSALWLISLIMVMMSAGSGAPAVSAQESFNIIVHPDNPAVRLSRRFVADAFLKRAVRWPDREPVWPVDLSAHSAVRSAFSEQVLGKPLTALRMHWQQLIFTGRGLPPPELASDAAVREYVLRQRGAIGYVSAGAPYAPARVVTLY